MAGVFYVLFIGDISTKTLAGVYKCINYYDTINQKCMATVRVKYRKSSVAGKEGTLYYQVIHNRTARQIGTGYRIRAHEWNRENATVVHPPAEDDRAGHLAAVRRRVAEDISRLNTIIAWLDRRGTAYSADDVVSQFHSCECEASFLSFMRRHARWLSEIGKARRAESCISTLNSLVRFLAGRDLLFDSIDTALMAEYEMFLKESGVTPNTSSFYMRNLRAVYNRAVEEGLAVQRHPFKRVYTGIEKTVKRALPLKCIRAIRRLDLTAYPGAAFARDLFMFSFYTRGMSFIDMAYLKKTDLTGGVLSYRRRKTGQRLNIRWEPCMEEITGRYNTSATPYLLPIITDTEGDERGQYIRMSNFVNRQLKTVGRLVGLPMKLTMYVSRHTWASIAKGKKIPTAVISEGLGHDSELTTRIYLASLDSGVIDRANRAIIADL